MKVVFGSVVYQMAERYLNDFLWSINKQIDGDFSLFLLNDDMDLKKLKEAVSGYSFRSNIACVANKTPVQLRIELLRVAKQEQIDLLIIGDCDDFFSETRVKNTVRTYVENPEYTFFYNELCDVQRRKIMPKLPDSVYNFKQIGEYNFLGLSNTALNMQNISYDFINSLEEYQYEIFDWYLYSRLLLDNKLGKKVNGCVTMYRLHENNIAGIRKFDEAGKKYEIEIKKKHYESLQKYHAYYVKKYRQYQHSDGLECLEEYKKYFWWNFLRAIE